MVKAGQLKLCDYGLKMKMKNNIIHVLHNC